MVTDAEVDANTSSALAPCPLNKTKNIPKSIETTPNEYFQIEKRCCWK
ncbi:hypothetical protein [Streptococcus gallolyticus]|nr:hypothetical protein [Streptococcus gallolyticus]